MFNKVFPSLPTLEYKKYLPFLESGLYNLTVIWVASLFASQFAVNDSMANGCPSGLVKRKSVPSGEIDEQSSFTLNFKVTVESKQL